MEVLIPVVGVVVVAVILYRAVNMSPPGSGHTSSVDLGTIDAEALARIPKSARDAVWSSIVAQIRRELAVEPFDRPRLQALLEHLKRLTTDATIKLLKESKYEDPGYAVLSSQFFQLAEACIEYKSQKLRTFYSSPFGSRRGRKWLGDHGKKLLEMPVEEFVAECGGNMAVVMDSRGVEVDLEGVIHDLQVAYASQQAALLADPLAAADPAEAVLEVCPCESEAPTPGLPMAIVLTSKRVAAISWLEGTPSLKSPNPEGVAFSEVPIGAARFESRSVQGFVNAFCSEGPMPDASDLQMSIVFGEEELRVRRIGPQRPYTLGWTETSPEAYFIRFAAACEAISTVASKGPLAQRISARIKGAAIAPAAALMGGNLGSAQALELYGQEWSWPFEAGEEPSGWQILDNSGGRGAVVVSTSRDGSRKLQISLKVNR